MDEPPTSRSARPTSATPGAGTRLGPWELRELIGSGGMGDVWAAVRVDGLHTGRAAVKLLRVRHHDDALASLVNARFAREGELLARLTHPHIAQLYDAGFGADGTRYLVLEYVAGTRIDRWCDARRLSVEARLRLLLQVCAAVSFAHANLIVHRDLKPANILITEEGHAKLLDFGVAKLLEDTPDGDDLTNLGSAGMTPQYAAPEQITGDAVTVATDVYALGVLLFVLLSGQRPYRAAGARVAQPAQLALAITEAEPLALSAEIDDAEHPAGSVAVATARSTTPQRLRQQLRGDLEHIVAKALRKRPSERYASVQALADDLGRYLKNESVSAQAPTPLYLARKFVQRHRVVVAGGALVMIAVVAGVGATLWQYSVAREQASIARVEAANANAIKDFLLGVFNTTRVGDGKVATETTARELLQNGGKQLLVDKQLAPDTKLELLWVVGTLQDNLGLFDASDSLQQEALRLARSVHGPTDDKYVYALVERALSLGRLGKHNEAAQLAGEAVTVMDRTGHQKLESYPVALYQLGSSAMQTGELQTGVGYLKRSTAAFDADQPRHAMRAIAHRLLGNAYARLDDFPAAEQAYHRSLEAGAGQAAQREYAAGLGHYALGDLLVKMGRPADAKPELAQALAITSSTLGLRDRTIALIQLNIGRAEHALGNRAAADAAFASALDIAHDDPSRVIGNAVDRSNVALADIALDEGRIDESLARLRTAVARWEKQGGAPWAMLLVSQAECESLRSEHDEALQHLRRALPVLDAKLGPGSLSARQARVVLGDVHWRRSNATDQARLAYAAARASPLDENAASPTRTLLLARATLGEARLAVATDAPTALRLSREAIAMAGTTPVAMRGRIVGAQARVVEAQALAATGQASAAQSGMRDAISTLTSVQAPESPRLAEARLALNGLRQP